MGWLKPPTSEPLTLTIRKNFSFQTMSGNQGDEAEAYASEYALAFRITPLDLMDPASSEVRHNLKVFGLRISVCVEI